MDVQCERCKTEYIFDDALVSGRGTTVRCTTCGHQFKVRRADAGDQSGDRWVVQTLAGQQLTFLTLRELQRAILARQVVRGDALLIDGNREAIRSRPLGSITELEPFFEGRATSRPPPPAMARGPLSALPSAGFGGIDMGASHPPMADPRPPPSPRPPPPGTLPLHQAPGTPELWAGESLPPAMGPMAAPLPAPTLPIRRALPSGDDDEIREPYSAFPPSSDDAYDIPHRRRVGGWVVAFVLFLAVGVVGWVVAKRYVVSLGAVAGRSSLVQLEPRALAFVAEGERALADGDLDEASQAFDKASALAERDPRVAIDLARVAAARADIPWLTLRLLPTDAVEDVRTTRALLDERLAHARKAAADAAALAAEDPAAVRARIDVFRLLGERDTARGYVTQMGGISSQPETAYVLAALDLSEPQPLWTTVIDRLRVAAGGEGNAGRARAALVYALAQSGDVAAAKSELARLDALARPYPCLPWLHSLVDRAKPKVSPDAGTMPDAGTAMGSARSEHAVIASPTPQPSSAGASAAGADTLSAYPASAMQMAGQAIKNGDWARARRVYEAIAARNPSDSEALAGIGDVARAQGDSAGAIAAYKRALAVNPSYLPAMLGVADTQWASGDRAAAAASYKVIADHFPEGAYPAYVKGRAEGSTTPEDPTTGAAPTAPTTAVPRPSPKPFDPGNGI